MKPCGQEALFVVKMGGSVVTTAAIEILHALSSSPFFLRALGKAYVQSLDVQVYESWSKNKSEVI